MTSRRLLGLFAHSDDESRIVGGALAKYASEGVSIHRTPEELPQVREAELREACRILGVHNLTILDYRDGTLDAVDRAGLIGHIVEAIRQVQPHVLLTFGPEGRTQHPDHIAIHEAATAAFHLAADAQAYPEQGLPPFSVPKLYYSAIPESQARSTSWRFPSISDDEVTVALDVSPWIDQKRRATNEAHRTQAHDQPFGNLPEAERWEELSREYFHLTATHGITRPEREEDVFTGLA